MVKQADKNKARLKRHKRVRAKISGTALRPRLNVFRSTNNIYAQLIDDVAGVTLASASTLDKELNGYGGNKEAAKKVGKLIAERAAQKILQRSYLTAADIYFTDASKNWLRALVRAA